MLCAVKFRTMKTDFRKISSLDVVENEEDLSNFKKLESFLKAKVQKFKAKLLHSTNSSRETFLLRELDGWEINLEITQCRIEDYLIKRIGHEVQSNLSI